MVDVSTIDNNFNGMDGKEFNGEGRITGTSKADMIFVHGGDALVNAGAGDDLAFGGAGNDKIDAGDGNDVVYGGAGNDILGGGAGNDVLIGGDGNDQIDGGTGDDVLSGGSGNDTFNFKAGFGHDIITDFTFGGAEGDKLNIYAGAAGNAKNITITSKADLDALVDNHLATKTVDIHGAATFTFNGGSDSLTFLNYEEQTSGTPNASGSSGNDVLHTGTLAGQITGGAGNDIAIAGSGDTNANGDAGHDVVVGGAGKDLVSGGAGDDVLFGGNGNDTLAAGAGNDILTGGAGADTFLFKGDFGHDIVTDLNFDEGDSLSFNSDVTGLVKITSDAELQSFIAAHSATSVDGDTNLLINIDADHSIKLIGHGSGAVVV